MKHGIQSNLNQYSLNPRPWILKMAPEETISYSPLNKKQDIFWFSVYTQFLIQIRHQSDKNTQRLWGEPELASECFSQWADSFWSVFLKLLSYLDVEPVCTVRFWKWLCDLPPMLSRLMVYTGDSNCYPYGEVWAVIRVLDWIKWGKQPASVL